MTSTMSPKLNKLTPDLFLPSFSPLIIVVVKLSAPLGATSLTSSSIIMCLFRSLGIFFSLLELIEAICAPINC